MSLLLLENDEPGWAHWCVITTGVGRLSLEDPEAVAPDDPQEKIIEISETIRRAVERSSIGYQDSWKPSASIELAFRMLADPNRPDAPSQVTVTHPSELSRSDVIVWPERNGRGGISVGEDLKIIIPERPCRALMRRSGSGDKVLALDAPTSTIMLPALDAVSMLRLLKKASRSQKAG